jgi:NhaP-type Na+/H+ and K+/H+ antiporter
MSFWEQVKGKTKAVQIKMRLILLENNLEDQFFRLGNLAYENSKSGLPLLQGSEIQFLFRDITAKKKELATLKEEFQKIWGEEEQVLKSRLEKRGGIMEQVAIPPTSPVKGKRVKDLTLPKEVLLGPILRDEELIIPDGDTELKKGDRITLMGKRKDVAATVELLMGNIAGEETPGR